MKCSCGACGRQFESVQLFTAHQVCGWDGQLICPTSPARHPPPGRARLEVADGGVLRCARGWRAVWNGSRLRRRTTLPGGTAGLWAALRALNDAGMLPLNCIDDSLTGSGRSRTSSCPRCGRPTAANYWDDVAGEWVTTIPTVCTGCRADYLLTFSQVRGR